MALEVDCIATDFIANVLVRYGVFWYQEGGVILSKLIVLLFAFTYNLYQAEVH